MGWALLLLVGVLAFGGSKSPNDAVVYKYKGHEIKVWRRADGRLEYRITDAGGQLVAANLADEGELESALVARLTAQIDSWSGTAAIGAIHARIVPAPIVTKVVG